MAETNGIVNGKAVAVGLEDLRNGRLYHHLTTEVMFTNVQCLRQRGFLTIRRSIWLLESRHHCCERSPTRVPYLEAYTSVLLIRFG